MPKAQTQDKDIQDALFRLALLADDRAVHATHVNGAVAHQRGAETQESDRSSTMATT
ncbi:hypothetical protein J4H86_26475 [Spiractinospora alimapuensis]|uniref:hypothetical protein n=1 Tax=Spiractinospora alimapuensis TaxID=2820884 RepID=UPI001F25BC46|nr:hypothetical protein [Spiractinospora alimapuensis]QVQ52200.1 hypothetical protein J4H86_26475 [Spiractinospora alimapuensis]